MSWRTLPPTGHPLVLADAGFELPEIPGYRAVWLQSGTAALALALIAARRRSPHITQPQVVLPGYACPDLVAAALFAGVQPVLADIAIDDPAYDFDSLQAALSANTVAVVAVNFLGLRERLAQLRKILAAYPSALLIEDDAQWFPEPFPAATLHGDMVCLSFGRGKPVSLLGGGVLLIANTLELPDISDVVQAAEEAGSAFPAKALIYNALLSPWLYGPVSKLPFLQVGVTKLKTLSAIRAMDARRKKLLAANIQAYLSRSQRCADAIAAELPAVVVDLTTCARERAGRWLRYPILLPNREIRDAALQKLQCAGLGATALYQAVLPDIEGVAVHVVVSGTLVGAKQFAGRLLTLPVHDGVTATDVKRMGELLRDL